MRKIALAAFVSVLGALLAPVGVAAEGTPPAIPTPVRLASGFTHTCALFDDGKVACWGTNTYGQLGNGSTVSGTTPVGVLGLSDVVQIDSGLSHTCALTDSGDVYCWGRNQAGQLGQGDVNSSAVPVKVAGVSNAVSVATGYFHSCAASSAGTSVKCWGAGAFGALGNGSEANALTATAVGSFGTVQRLYAGHQSTCASMTTSLVQCWGETAYDAVTGTQRFSTTPRPLADTQGAAVFASDLTLGFNHACASTDGLLCWGWDLDGQSGGQPEPDMFEWDIAPAPVEGVLTPTTISAGAYVTCFVGSAATQLSCMGLDSVAFVESGFTSRPSLATRPESVAGLRSWFFESEITDLDSGFYHTCFIASGQVSCIGANHLGQANGNSNVPPASIEPLPVTFGALMSFAQNLDELTRADEFVPDHANVLRLYRASFDREPDLGGSLYWISIWNGGASLEEIAYQFAFSAEFELRYGDQLTNEEFLEVVYQNVLGREYDQDGFDYWLNLLETDQLGRAGAIQWISLGNEFVNSHPYPTPVP
jgi:hypothetical protein